jgi:hypothetical protein
MKGLLWRASTVVTALFLVACQGSMPEKPNPDSGTNGDPYAPCTNAGSCCQGQEVANCIDPDGKFVPGCGCAGLWDCSQNPKKCQQTAPVPGGGDWVCTWTEFKYTCTQKNPNGPGSTPPGGGDWVCKWNDKEFQWECSKNPPNPSNKPDGTTVWKCKIDVKTLVCERAGSDVPPPGGGTWDCKKDASGKEICTKTDENNGLPPGGSNWKCNRTTENGAAMWVCVGDSSGSPPPGGGGWTCTQMAEFNKWKCTKLEGPSDNPPGGGWYACTKGTEFNGTVCEKVQSPPTPPKPGDACIVGAKMWCDGLQYCGWGQVMCDPATGKWKTKNVGGKEILDCQELSTGERPNTVCACYHFFFNPGCCERPDCIIPAGSNGQICPPSKGGLCDYCNPLTQGDCKATGAKCIVTNNHETFCGQLCSASAPCPSGYNCMVVKLQVGNTNQCVPTDFSCYY